MNHIMAVKEANRAFERPWNAQCTCGSAGDFEDKAAAVAFANSHLQRYKGVGVSTTELIFPEPKKVPPAVHVVPVPPGPAAVQDEDGRKLAAKPTPPPPPPAPKVA